MEEYKIKPIAKIYTDFPEKFGLPRQSGLIDALKGRIVFEPPYRDFAAVKELSEYSHISRKSIKIKIAIMYIF